MNNFWKDKRVLITGSTGFVGSHLVEKLKDLESKLFLPSSTAYDLRDRYTCDLMLRDIGDVDILINLAANVGGIGYNQAHPYSLYYDNACIGLHLIDAARRNKVGKFVQLGTVCAYPKFAPVPFDERSLWDGYPEETNAPYGLAKRNTLVQLQAARQEFGFNGIFILPTNLYGPRDTFNPEQSHVIPALIKKFIEAKQSVEIWGTGDASRDFLYIDDAIDGILLLAEKYNNSDPVNLGSGEEIRISVLAYLIGEITEFKGTINFNISKPDGQPRRRLRTWIANEIGWKPKVALKEGLQRTVGWYKVNYVEEREITSP